MDDPLSPSPHATRRLCVAATVVSPLWWVGDALARQALTPTPAQTEGPFYPLDTRGDTDFDLLHRDNRVPYQGGQPAWLSGRVVDVAGRPVSGARVEIWQCDHQGRYHHPGDGNAADPSFQGFGRVAVDTEGRWRFRTIRPVAYSGRTPHIHVKVRLGRRELLTTQMYVAGEPRNDRDGLWRSLSPNQREALTRAFQPTADGLAADFPIVVMA
jgi:protocatechuate 3,4-dioxygenase, beta subunit